MSEISEEATRLIDNFEYAVEDAVSYYTMAGGASYKNQARYNLEDYIAELEVAQRWIPVSERLPDNWESVLTIDISKSTRDMVTAFYNPETSLWSTHFSCDLWVTHWMPLPEPPIVYGKEREE